MQVASLVSLPVVLRLRIEEFSRLSKAASLFVTLAQGFLPGEISALQKVLSGVEGAYYRAYHRQNVTTLQVRDLLYLWMGARFCRRHKGERDGASGSMLPLLDALTP